MTVMRFRCRPRLVSLWVALLVTWGCKERKVAPPPRVVKPVSPTVATRMESAALLVVDGHGTASIVCLPDEAKPSSLFPGIEIAALLDLTSYQGSLWVAALIGPLVGPSPRPSGTLMLLSPDKPPRRLGNDVRYARFSPTGDALVFESVTRSHVGGGIIGLRSKSRWFDLVSGNVGEVGDFADPRWEADGRHVRATQLLTRLREQRGQVRARISANRIRYDRNSKSATVVGPGSSQVPAPRGNAVVLSDEPEVSGLTERCSGRLEDGVGGTFAVAGTFCQGWADERELRWSPDGRYLAFPAFPSTPENVMGTDHGLFIDIVSVSGERHPALPALLAQRQHDPAEQTRTSARRFTWLDWAPSAERLAVEDSDNEVWLYDLVQLNVAKVVQGRQPVWSPGGDYLVLLSPQATHDQPREAMVLVRGSAGSKISLGVVRDVHWLAPGTCGKKKPE
jgi:hypothetical protein